MDIGSSEKNPRSNHTELQAKIPAASMLRIKMLARQGVKPDKKPAVRSEGKPAIGPARRPDTGPSSGLPSGQPSGPPASREGAKIQGFQPLDLV